MKSLMLINLFALLTVFSACAQTNVPDAVKQTFNSKFTNAKSVSWDMEGKNDYEVELEKGEMTKKVLFSVDGKVINQKNKEDKDDSEKEGK